MNSPLTPLDFSRRARRLYKNREAVVDGEVRLSYQDFFERCDRWSSVLQSYGIQPGDRVAYIAPNTHGHLESFYAVPQIGAVLVPINHRLSSEEFKYILNHSGARVLCVHEDFIGVIDGIRDQLDVVERYVALTGARDGWISYGSELERASSEFESVTIQEDDLISINYTSGTTSRPKGVMISHRNAWINSMGTMVHLPLTAADRYLWTLPMFHANGWTFVWTVTALGATHVCLPKAAPDPILERVETESITLFCAAPTVLIGILSRLEETKQKVRKGIRVWTAGAPPAAATIERLETELGWELTQVYGLTETSPFITICEALPEHAACPREEQSKIKARQGVELVCSGELMVMDDDEREVLPDGETRGEIVVRGNAVMKGYYRDPDATEKAMRGGWFHSGDVAVVHPDGYVEIQDRLKDVIISGGENISSVEIEGVLLQHEAVLEAAVVGMPHQRWGESPHAFIRLRTGKFTTEDEIIRFVRDRLAHFKAPQWITFVDELPKTATGKVQKFILRGKRAAIVKQ